MLIVTRRRKIAFFATLGVGLVALAVALNVGWIILNWREGVLLFFGVMFFAAIIVGMILNTSFLIREIKRNEQHDSFINAVTHELKTPVASIRLYLETLQRRELSEEQRQDFYKRMLSDSDRLQATVEQVLKAGRAGFKRGPKYRTEVEFGGMVAECMEMARSRYNLGSDAIHFEPALNGEKFLVRGDPEELRTAVYNVLDNAVKYSAPGNVDVAVKLEAPDPKQVVLKVSDRGVGISPDDLKRVFKRFYRIPRQLGAKGTGLGLFIVRAVARTHGGKVRAESEGEGRGTTVVFELPASKAS
jgi:signal transduction histidine kinase